MPADNPFPGSRVYSLGHRNVQGLAWDAMGLLFATELGQNTSDEVNRVRSGNNYGWPVVVEGDANNPNYTDPAAVFSPADASPSWNGDFFTATLRDQSLYRLELEGDRVTGTARLLNGAYGRLRHVAATPDGPLRVLS